MTYSQLSKGSRAIVAKFELATSQEVQSGCDWYSHAFHTCARMGKMYEVPISKCAAVIAALSPNNRWERNIKDAEDMIKAFKYGDDDDVMAVKCCTYTMNKLKALNILKSNDCSGYETILNGPKTVEFYHCIMLEDDVCIDGHAYSIWYGSRLTMKEVPNIGKKLRERIKQDYREATDFINEELSVKFSTSQIQAITWVCHRRIYGV